MILVIFKSQILANFKDLELGLFTKCNNFLGVHMFNFEQKCNQTRNSITLHTDDKCLLVAWRWNIWNLVSHDFVFFFILTRNTLHTYWRARDPETKPLFSRPSQRTCHDIRRNLRVQKRIKIHSFLKQ